MLNNNLLIVYQHLKSKFSNCVVQIVGEKET